MVQCLSCGTRTELLYETRVAQHDFYMCTLCSLVFTSNNTGIHEDFYGERDRDLVENIAQQFSLNNKSFLLHVGSGTGSFLKFVKSKSIPCLGIEENQQYFQTATSKHVDTINSAFDVTTAWDMLSESNAHTNGKKFDAIILRRALQRTEKISETLEAVSLLLRDDGLCLIEIDWILELLATGVSELDKYEDRSIFSLHALRFALSQHDLEMVDIQRIQDDRRLRLFVRHKDLFPTSPFVTEYFGEEVQAQILDIERFRSRFC